MIDIIKALFIGIVQGITEWLPVSSTGHMILFDELVHMNVSDEFKELFLVVIQLGSILAVLTLYFGKLNPFARSKSSAEKKQTWRLWSKVIVAALPAAVIGLLFDDLLDRYLYNYITVAVTLIVYGVAFIVIERHHAAKGTDFKIATVEDIDYATALKIGAAQVLALIPGTSRSGSTIIGSMCVGVSRTAAAEFSFFLAIPVMLGASALKLLKYIVRVGASFTQAELITLVVGIVTAFAVSVVAIKFLMGFVRRHSFEGFGWYRIVLGVVVIGYFVGRSFIFA